MQYNADFYIERLLNHYNISTISELAQILNTKQTSISSWRARNSINAIKKKCRELGIYKEIFEDTKKSDEKRILEDYISFLEHTGQESSREYLDTVEHAFLSEPIGNIDFATYVIFKEAYIKAIKNDDLKGFRIHLMDY